MSYPSRVNLGENQYNYSASEQNAFLNIPQSQPPPTTSSTILSNNSTVQSQPSNVILPNSYYGDVKKEIYNNNAYNPSQVNNVVNGVTNPSVQYNSMMKDNNAYKNPTTVNPTNNKIQNSSFNPSYIPQQQQQSSQPPHQQINPLSQTQRSPFQQQQQQQQQMSSIQQQIKQQQQLQQQMQLQRQQQQLQQQQPQQIQQQRVNNIQQQNQLQQQAQQNQQQTLRLIDDKVPSYYYEIDIEKGTYGLGMNVEESQLGVTVKGFLNNPDGSMGQAQRSGKILAGDILMEINHRSLYKVVFSEVINLLKNSGNNLHLKFRRINYDQLKPTHRDVRGNFSYTQTEQLRNQIIAHRFFSDGHIPNTLVLSLAYGEISRNGRTTLPEPIPNTNRKKSGRKKKPQNDDEDYIDYIPKTNTEPIRHSLREVSRKSYKEDDDIDDENNNDNNNSDKESTSTARSKDEKDENKWDIDKILGIRYYLGKDSKEEVLELLIKWKGKSYTHVQWVSKEILDEMGLGKSKKLIRYLNQHLSTAEHIKSGEDKVYDDYFPATYTEIERILAVREVPVEVANSRRDIKSGLLKNRMNEEYIQSLVRAQQNTQNTQNTQKTLNIPNTPSTQNTPSTVSTITTNSTNITNPIQTQNQPTQQPQTPQPMFQLSGKMVRQFLVKWNGLSFKEITWENEDEIEDPQMITQYYQFNYPPPIKSLHLINFKDERPPPQSWKQYGKTPEYLKKGNDLRGYQLEGLNWLVFSWYNRRNCILADEMGLGKTVQTISLLAHLHYCEHLRGPFLILAPLSTLQHWKREVENWTDMNVVVYHDPEGGSQIRSDIRKYLFYYDAPMLQQYNIYKFNVLVTSYHILIQDFEVLNQIRWRYVVIDEAQRIKNRDTKFIQYLRDLRSDSRLLLTGTPIQNDVNELWSLLNFIEPKVFENEEEFMSKFGNLHDSDQVSKLQSVLNQYMLRRVKENVEKSIPPKEEIIIDIELTSPQKKYYRAIFDRNREFLSSPSGATMGQLINMEVELRKVCNHPFLVRGVEETETGNIESVYYDKLISYSGKMLLLHKLLPKLHNEKHKILIFTQFTHMLDLLGILISYLGYKYERLDGSIRGNSRQEAIDHFNKSEDCFIFILSTRAGGVGINLTAADTVIIYDSDWNPQNDIQAQARCHRIGQTKSVRVYRLITQKTYEAEMFSRASKKLGLHQAVFDSGGIQESFNRNSSSGNGGGGGGGNDVMNEGEKMNTLMEMDRSKIDMLLRYGAYAIMDDDKETPVTYSEEDIDRILSSSRVLRYNDENGNNNGNGNNGNNSNVLSLSKATFKIKSEDGDEDIDFKDPQFWEKVLGPRVVTKLQHKIKDNFLNTASDEEIDEFMTELGDLVNQVIESRLDGKIHDDTHEVVNLLIAVRECGRKKLRSQADDWIEELERRRHRRKVDHQYTEYNDNESNDDDEVDDSPKPRKRHRNNNNNNDNNSSSHNNNHSHHNSHGNNSNRKRNESGGGSNWNNKHVSGIKIRLREMKEEEMKEEEETKMEEEEEENKEKENEIKLKYKIIEVLPKNILNGNFDNKNDHLLRSRRNRRKYNEDNLEMEDYDKDDEDYS